MTYFLTYLLPFLIYLKNVYRRPGLARRTSTHISSAQYDLQFDRGAGTVDN